MKISVLGSSALLAVASILSSVPTTFGHIAMSFPPGQAGPWSNDPSNQVHAWIGFEGKKFPCGGYKRGPVTTLSAGQMVPVRFWNFNIHNYKQFPPPKGTAQARHGGGACEFSLSYDAGKTWHVIGQYTKSCPDIYYEWPVKIPSNVPSCSDPDKCLFSFSWTAFATNQFYHHCANVKINGVKNGLLPVLPMKVVDVKQLNQKMNVHALGQGSDSKGNGPDARQVKLNLSEFFACKGPAGKTGLDLGLVSV
ncbi:hypothetical protein BGW38_001233 [Lunasporangiospora selenospora]|uniref:Uncharacterized protein n=1 Tax=Lunasporangiospora selenospora TaxID=979761 RepID=A0A9P6G3Q2_9FUNG|nr:hypothetical protein BGW38_001233 [Lunasporangiospora selenospora]